MQNLHACYRILIWQFSLFIVYLWNLIWWFAYKSTKFNSASYMVTHTCPHIRTTALAWPYTKYTVHYHTVHYNYAWPHLCKTCSPIVSHTPGQNCRRWRSLRTPFWLLPTGSDGEQTVGEVEGGGGGRGEGEREWGREGGMKGGWEGGKVGRWKRWREEVREGGTVGRGQTHVITYLMFFVMRNFRPGPLCIKRTWWQWNLHHYALQQGWWR